MKSYIVKCGDKMEENYIILGLTKKGIYETVMRELTSGKQPTFEPLFFESFKEAKNHALTLDYKEIEIYRKIPV